MKRIISILMLGVLCTVLVACSSDETEDSSIGDNITVSDSETEIEPVEAERQYDVQLVMVLGDGVNIRTGAGTDYNVYTQAYTGDYFELTVEGESWHQIVYEGNVAFISANYSVVKTLDSKVAYAYLNGEEYDDATVADTDDDTDTSSDETTE